MPDVKRQVLLVTEHEVKVPAQGDNLPIRSWSIEVYLLNENGEKIPAKLFEKVTYHLHPSFGDRTIQRKNKPPFRLDEEGWGEFDMQIVCTVLDKDYTITHDLNFASPRYEVKHTLTFKNPKVALLNLLRESGPVPGDEPKSLKKRGGAAQQEEPAPTRTKKKQKIEKNIDLDKLADGLQKLGEDDLLQVVQMVNDHKTPESYTKNDPEQGEFHIDLYTLPDNLIKMLWDFTQSKLAA